MFDPSNNFIRMEIDDLQRRLISMIQMGKVAEVDAVQARLRVTIGNEATGNIVTTALLPWLSYRAGKDSSWWAPDVGEQVIVLSAGGELNNGVVLPAIYQDAYPAPDSNPDIHTTQYEDGTTIKYDRVNHTLNVDVQGGDITINTSANINVEAGGDAVIRASGAVNIENTNINLDSNSPVSGGVVCDTHVCSFTGSPHPQGSATVKAGG